MHKIFMCWRYLRSRRIGLFGTAAVGLCVALLIVVTSLFNGFIGEFHDYWRGRFGDVQFFVGGRMAEWGELVEHLEELDCVADATMLTETGALLYLGAGNVKGVELVGVDPAAASNDGVFVEGLLLGDRSDKGSVFELSGEARERAQGWLNEKLSGAIEQADMPVGAIVGIGVLGEPGELTDKYDQAAIGDWIAGRQKPAFIISGQRRGEGDGAVGVRKTTRPCWVVNAVQAGEHMADTKLVYLPFDYVRELTGQVGKDGKARCTGHVRIDAAEGFAVERVVKEVEDAWEQFVLEKMNWSTEMIAASRVEPSRVHLEVLTREVRKQLVIMEVILGFICGVVTLLVFVILFMLVMQKKRDIGIMRAVGSSRWSVAGLFLGYGGGIGAVGSLVGLGLGVWATRHINLLEGVLTKVLGFKMWHSGVYFLSEIPDEVDWSAVVWIMAAGVVTAMLGAVAPAVKAARLEPVVTLRYE